MDILLKDKISVNALGVDKTVNIQLPSRMKQMRTPDVQAEIDLYEQFIMERAMSSEYRFIVTITPYCTNVLYNPVSESVYYNAADKKWAWHFANSYKQANANLVVDLVEYKEPDQGDTFTLSGYSKIYFHPGFNVFDNHLLRSKNFVVVNSNSNNSENSISGKLRNANGAEIKTRQRRRWDMITVKESTHLYRVEDVYKFFDTDKKVYESFDANIMEDEGWFGFPNRHTMDTRLFGQGNRTSAQVCVDTLKQDKSFIDMYPDRTKFSFTAVYNPVTKTDEYNWDVIITYPAAISRMVVSTDNAGTLPSSPLVSVDVKPNAAGINVVVLRSFFRHNLQRGDRIRLFYEETEMGKTTYREYNNGESEVLVGTLGNEVGDNPDFCFTLANAGMVAWAQGFRNNTVRFVKVINGYDCDYYVRLFKPIDVRKEIYPVAFAQSVYGDKVTQITFTDGVDVDGLVDHRGRPLSELYVTVLKQNKGWKTWYMGGNNNTQMEGKKSGIDAADVDGSHCFCESVAGFASNTNIEMTDVGSDVETAMRRMHHIRYVTNVSGNNLQLTEGGMYYGDVVEYDPSNDVETVISDVYYRFNSVVREHYSSNNALKFIELTADDYDTDGFKVESRQLESARPMREGYYYKPHYRMALKQFGELQTGSHYDIDVVEAVPIVDGGLKISVRTLYAHGLTSGDTVRLYDDSIQGVDERYMEFNVTSVVNRARFVMYPKDGQWKYNYDSETKSVSPIVICGMLSDDIRVLTEEMVDVIRQDDNPELTIDNKETAIDAVRYYRLNDESLEPWEDADELIRLRNNYYHRLSAVNRDIPSYATRIGRNRYVWHNLLDNGDITATSIGDRIFANGAIYINREINFYLRRQDPDGYAGLNEIVEGNEMVPSITGNILPPSKYQYKDEEIDETC